MSKIGKLAGGFGFLFLVGAALLRGVMGFTHPSQYVALGIGVVLIIVAIAADHRKYLAFFTMRTTKHGLNMGWLILMAIAAVFIANFLSVKFNKKWDVTKEGFNSLSEQSKKIVAGLKSDVTAVLIFRKQEQEDSIKRQVEEVIRLYKDASPKFQFATYNALNRPDLAQKYEFKSGQVGLFLDYQDRHLKVDSPTEEGITKTLLKLTRDPASKKTVCFSKGHGERDLDTQKPESISVLKTELETVYNVKPIALLETGNVPDECVVLMIAGPTQPFMPGEIESVKKYAAKGGHIFIAADPGEHHNVPEIARIFGIDFKNQYILDTRASVPGAGPVAALGSITSKTSEITKSLPQNVLFILASPVTKAQDAPATFKFDDLLKTNQQAVVVGELSAEPKPIGQGPITVVMSSTGRLEAAKDKPSQDFSVVVVGDSDFMTNQLLFNFSNRDFLMNAASSLAKDEDLISIRPKTPKGSTLNLTGNAKYIIVLAIILLPVFLFLSSGVIWFRRRSA